MAYKVLNSVLLKDTSSMRIANLNEVVVVLVVEKQNQYPNMKLR